jgi:hypothetical protein
MWQDLGYVCYTGGHLAQTVITALATVIFVVLCALFSLVYYDSASLTLNLNAVSHGRAEFVFLIVKTVLVVFVDVFPKSAGGQLLCGLILIASALLVFVYTATMPYLHHLMNKVTLSIMNTFAWCSFCVLILNIYPGYDAAVMMYAGLPLAALSGIQLANWRAAWIVRTPIEKLHNFYEVEIKLRYIMTAGVLNDIVRVEGAHVETAATAQQDEARIKAEQDTLKADLEEADGGDSIEARILMLQPRLTPAVINEAQNQLKAGQLRFKGAPLLNVFAARFYSVYINNHHMEMRYESICMSMCPTTIAP